MKLQEQRQIALGAVRSQLRTWDLDPLTESAQDALKTLDDIARTEPKLIASIWYLQASDNQIALFIKEWNDYKKRFLN